MPRLRYRTVFISDVHLGTAACQADYLLNFLATIDCERLYLVGDIIDFWQIRKRGAHWPDSHTQVLSKLFELAGNGVEVIYIPGNHDEAVRPYCGNSFNGIRIERDAIHTLADGRRFHVSHGDEFDGQVQYSRLLRLVGDGLYIALSKATSLTNFIRRKLGRPYWSLVTFLKGKSRKAQLYIRQYERSAMMRARELKVDGYICGHIHQMGIQQSGAVTYCNTGDWVEHCTALTEDFNGVLKVLQWTDHLALQHSHEQAPVPLGALPEALSLLRNIG